MMRTFHCLLAICVALGAAACGEDSGLYGSECGLIGCQYDKITCQRYALPLPPAIIVHYKRTLEFGDRWTAQVCIDLEGIEKAEGQRFEDDEETIDINEFTQRVTLKRPGEEEQFPAFDGNFCHIKKGGDTPDKSMAGKCAFAFENGYFMTAEFECTLDLAEP